MLPHIREILAERLGPYFGDSHEQVMAWITVAEDRRVVVVVGAGFSRNAAWKPPRSGSASTAIPLWKRVDEVLSEGLHLQGEEGGAFDSLMLPDLYGETTGHPKYAHRLLELLPDDEIEPGSVHRALFNLHRPEAVVTTNQLDTLLDRGTQVTEPDSRWFAIRKDADLTQPRAERRVQLIYLHGHRSDPSNWVFGRSDYEDLERDRPVMMRRVRQLFSQHPVLFVGFSLTDPNFHALLRQVHRETGGSHAGMLAIMTSKQHSTFVDYWRQYGVRVATLSSAKDIGAGFEALFGVVGSVGRDRRPAEGILQFAEVEAALRAKSKFREKVDYLDSLFAARDQPGGGLRAADDTDQRVLLRKLWAQIALPSDLEARGRVLGGPRFVSRADLTAEGWSQLSDVRQAEIAEDERFPDLEGLPNDRFERRDRTARLVASALREGASRAEIVHWLRLWFEEFVDKGKEPDAAVESNVAEFCDVLSWATSTTPDALGREKSTELVRRCAEIVERYQDRRAARVLGDLEEVAPSAIARESKTSQSPLAQGLLVLRDQALRGELEAVSLAYADAASQAGEEGQPWYEWLALKGAIGAYDTLDSDWRGDGRAFAKANATRRADWAQRCDSLESGVEVGGWLNRLRDRKNALLLHAVRDADIRERERTRGREVWISSGPRYSAWKSWRDLEKTGASPWHLREHGALVNGGMFAGDEIEEIRQRIGYLTKDTDEWLLDVAFRSEPADRVGRQVRDESVTAAVLATEPNQTASVGALRAVPGLHWFAQETQVDSIANLLETTRQSAGMRTRTYAGTHELDRDYGRGWLSFGRLISTAPQLDRLNKHLSTLRSPREWDPIIEGGASLPWLAWSQRWGAESVCRMALQWSTENTKTRWCKATLGLAAADSILSSDGTDLVGDELRGDILDLSLEAAGFDGLLSKSVTELALRVTARLGTTSQLRKVVAIAYPHVWGSASSIDDAERGRVVDRVEDLSDVLDATLLHQDGASLADEVFSALSSMVRSQADLVLEYSTKNPHLGIGWSITRAIARYLGNRPTAVPSSMVQLLLKLVDVEPHALSGMAAILTKDYWGKHWELLVEVVVRHARPSASPSSEKYQFAVARLLRETLEHDQVARQNWLIPGWAAMLSNCTGPSAVLANNQAILAATVLCGDVFKPEDAVWEMAVAGTRAAALDPRPPVRLGVAHARRKLGVSGAEELGDLPRVLAASDERESYAAILAEVGQPSVS